MAENKKFSNLSGRIYDNFDEIISLYKDEKYRWIDTCKREQKRIKSDT